MSFSPLRLRLAAALALLAAGFFPAAETGSAEPAAAETSWFRSNSIGLALGPADPAAAAGKGYALQVERAPGREVRRLCLDGKEVERWEDRLDDWGTLRETRRFVRGAAVEVLLYDENGRVREEQRLEDGRTVERTVYRYGPLGLSSAETFDSEGRPAGMTRYRLSPRGELREVEREEPDVPQESYALVRGGGQLFEERTQTGAGETLSWYDADGRLRFRELWRGGQRRTTLEYSYRGQTLDSMVETDLASGVKTVRSFDDRGELRREEGREQDTEVFRDGQGRKVRQVRNGERGLEEWRYSYDGKGRLEREEYRQKGVLVKVTRWESPPEALGTPGADGQSAGDRSAGGTEVRVEELYREGSPFLRVTYRQGERVREEVLGEGGRVLRVREYAGTAPPAPGPEVRP